MTPPVASFSNSNPDPVWSAVSLKQHLAAQQSRSIPLKDAKIEAFHQHVPIVAGKEPVEDFEGNYVFAEIKESHTSRAMTSRYYNDMMNSAVSDVVIIGAGSAGLTLSLIHI